MRILRDIKAQSTVEFALVVFGLLVVVIALATVWSAFESGLFVDHSLSSASHHVQNVSIGVIADVFIY